MIRTSFKTTLTALKMLGLGLGISLVGCTKQGADAEPGTIPFTLHGDFSSTNAPIDSIKVIDRIGRDEVLLAGAKLNKNTETMTATFSLSGKIPQPGVYFIMVTRKRPFEKAPPEPAYYGEIVLNNEPNFYMKVTPLQGYKLANYYEGSKLNDALKRFYYDYTPVQQKLSGVYSMAQLAKMPAEMEKYAKQSGMKPSEFRREVDKAVKTLDSLVVVADGIRNQYMQVDPVLATLVRLYLTPLYGTSPAHSKYEGPEEYYRQAFFSNDSLENGQTAYVPQFYQKVGSYIQTVSNHPKLKDKFAASFEALHKRAKPGSRTERILLAAATDAMEFTSDSLYKLFAEQYLKSFGGTPAASKMKKMVAEINKLEVGSTAPEIRMAKLKKGIRTEEDAKTKEKKTIDTYELGDTLALSSLRGKYVLVDFWASWCRPCREENPTTVRLYEEYKSRGFEILGVSVDMDAAAWGKAVQEDGLTWLQVSDLQGQNSKAGQTYRIRQIPTTLLLDKSGKIVAKNLRGEALRAKVAELVK